MHSTAETLSTGTCTRFGCSVGWALLKDPDQSRRGVDDDLRANATGRFVVAELDGVPVVAPHHSSRVVGQEQERCSEACEEFLELRTQLWRDGHQVRCEQGLRRGQAMRVSEEPTDSNRGQVGQES